MWRPNHWEVGLSMGRAEGCPNPALNICSARTEQAKAIHPSLPLQAEAEQGSSLGHKENKKKILHCHPTSGTGCELNVNTPSPFVFLGLRQVKK